MRATGGISGVYGRIWGYFWSIWGYFWGVWAYLRVFLGCLGIPGGISGVSGVPGGVVAQPLSSVLREVESQELLVGTDSRPAALSGRSCRRNNLLSAKILDVDWLSVMEADWLIPSSLKMK